VEKFYFPLDFGFAVRKALDAVRPSAVAVMETEIWPNFIIGLSKRKIPVFIINGRLSERSSRGYKRIKFVFKNILRMIEAFSMQSEADSRRIKDIGAPAERVTVTGNMKFDVTPPEAAFKKEDLGLGQENFLIFGASTHKGEEKILTELYARLKKDFPGLRLLIAPRHVDRSREIAGMIREMDLSVSFISELKREKAKNEIFILDTMGELLKFLSAADLVFMGGSLVKRGGHNLVEPALFGKAMLFGPNMFNFRRMRDIFLEEKAALEVKDGEGLTAAAKELISDEAKRRALGEAARAIIEKNKGATERNLDMLSRVFKI